MPTMDLRNAPILVAVVGATGQQGGATARALLAAGQRVRALTRNPGSPAARALADAGAEVVRADLDDRASVLGAFAGADAVFGVTTMTEAGTEGETRQGVTLADAAAEAGVPHVLYSSVGAAERNTGIPHFESKRRVEEHLETLPLRSTFLRPTFFMTNLTRFLAPQVEDGVLVLRVPLRPEVPLQMIAPEDVGIVAAALLVNPDATPGGALEIAGDELTPEQVAATFGEVRGMTARFEPVPLEALAGDPDQQRMFAWFAETPAFQADFGLTRELDPEVMDLETFLRGGPPAPEPDDRDTLVEANVAEAPHATRDALEG